MLVLATFRTIFRVHLKKEKEKEESQGGESMEVLPIIHHS